MRGSYSGSSVQDVCVKGAVSGRVHVQASLAGSVRTRALLACVPNDILAEKIESLAAFLDIRLLPLLLAEHDIRTNQHGSRRCQRLTARSRSATVLKLSVEPWLFCIRGNRNAW